MKHVVDQKCEMSNQEKQASYPEGNIESNVTKGPQRLRNLGNTYYKNAIFQCHAEETSKLASAIFYQIFNFHQMIALQKL